MKLLLALFTVVLDKMKQNIVLKTTNGRYLRLLAFKCELIWCYGYYSIKVAVQSFGSISRFYRVYRVYEY